MAVQQQLPAHGGGAAAVAQYTGFTNLLPQF